MAISTSAPELFTNVIGTFVTKGDLGVGMLSKLLIRKLNIANMF